MKIETYTNKTAGWCFAAGIWDGAGTYIVQFNFWRWEFGAQVTFS